MLVVSALLNSSRQCSKASPVWPMYTSVHEANDTQYSTPGFYEGGKGEVGMMWLCVGGHGQFGHTSDIMMACCCCTPPLYLSFKDLWLHFMLFFQDHKVTPQSRLGWTGACTGNEFYVQTKANKNRIRDKGNTSGNNSKSQEIAEHQKLYGEPGVQSAVGFEVAMTLACSWFSALYIYCFFFSHTLSIIDMLLHHNNSSLVPKIHFTCVRGYKI